MNPVVQRILEDAGEDVWGICNDTYGGQTIYDMAVTDADHFADEDEKGTGLYWRRVANTIINISHMTGFKDYVSMGTAARVLNCNVVRAARPDEMEGSP